MCIKDFYYLFCDCIQKNSLSFYLSGNEVKKEKNKCIYILLF